LKHYLKCSCLFALGMLEVFHSVLLKYAPKRQEFDYPQMTTRLQLAALDHNHNTNRPQAVVHKPTANSAAKGELRFRTRWSKATSQWVVEPIKEDKDYSFAINLLEETVNTRLSGVTLGRVERPPHMPKNTAPKQMECSKEELVANKKSRFENHS
jgi:hypothetical protein